MNDDRGEEANSTNNPTDPIRDRIENAEPVTPAEGKLTVIEGGKQGQQPPLDDGAPAHGGAGSLGEGEGGDAGLDRLTPAQWKILERCVGMDENDTDNGKRLLAWFGDQLLHVAEAGWHTWVGTHWEGDIKGQHAVERSAQELVPFIKRESGLMTASQDDLDAIEKTALLREEFPVAKDRTEDVKLAIKAGETATKAAARARFGRYQFAVRSGDRSRTTAMIAQAAPFRSINPDEMDKDNYAINCLNGTLRLRKVIDDECPDPDVERVKSIDSRLDDHNPEDKISKVTACNYAPEATAPIWTADFERFMPDSDVREFLQVFMGYCALGLAGEQIYAFNYGDGGNWKSAFLQSVGRMLGTYCLPMSFGSISGNSLPSGDKPSPDWARLTGVRFLTIEEVPRREPIKEEQIKVMTSGSPMPVRHLNKGLFDLHPKFTAAMASNAEPNITGGDYGIWRRTLIVHWQVQIPETEQLAFDQVMAMYEPERAGILNWVIEGAKIYMEKGLKPFVTDAMRLYTASLRRDRDPFGAFCEDVLEHRHGSNIAARYLYNTFERWCANNGVDPVPSETRFGRDIKRVIVTSSGAEPEIDPRTGAPVARSMGDRKYSPGGIKTYADIYIAHPPPRQQEDTVSPHPL